MEYNIEEIGLKTGINPDKINKEIQVMDALHNLTILLGNSMQKFGLYGGTAMNKIYFGEKQRLSYDLDIEAYTYMKTKQTLTNVSSVTTSFSKADRFTYKNVQIDLTKATGFEMPKLYTATSLISFFNYPIAEVVVQSYSLEYLLARKTLALLSRVVDKDIYDTWMGLNMVKDIEKYRHYIKKFMQQEHTDSKYLISQLEYYLDNEIIKNERAKIEVIMIPNLRLMTRDILSKFEEFGIKSSHS